jgi:hypothetical protein
MSNPLCINCQHYSKVNLLEYCDRVVKINPVNGDEYLYTCYSERQSFGTCGPQGIHFVPNEDINQLELDYESQ